MLPLKNSQVLTDPGHSRDEIIKSINVLLTLENPGKKGGGGDLLPLTNFKCSQTPGILGLKLSYLYETETRETLQKKKKLKPKLLFLVTEGLLACNQKDDNREIVFCHFRIFADRPAPSAAVGTILSASLS